jgi:hypothetical protein
MPKGGFRPGAGRKPGIPNKARTEVLEKARATGLLPHELLLAVSQGQEILGHVPTFEEMVSAAEKAAPYYAPRLASVEAKVAMTVEDLDEAQLNAEILREGMAAGLISGGSTH